MSRTLFLSPPSFDGFDGGAGARYQAKREVTSYWYPTWLAQPAALVPGAKLMDCPPHNIGIEECLREAQNYDHVIIAVIPMYFVALAYNPGLYLVTAPFLRLLPGSLLLRQSVGTS